MDSAQQRDGRKWRLRVDAGGATSSSWQGSLEECQARATAIRERAGTRGVCIDALEYIAGDMRPIKVHRL